jgi:hypothetical protein
VAPRRYYRFASHMRQICSDHEIGRDTRDQHQRSGKKSATYAEKST